MSDMSTSTPDVSTEVDATENEATNDNSQEANSSGGPSPAINPSDKSGKEPWEKGTESKPAPKPKSKSEDTDDDDDEEKKKKAEPKKEGDLSAAQKEEIRRHKLKINGREMELDEAEVLRRAQLSSSADEKFQEAAQMRKQAEQLIQTLRESPDQVLEKLGIDIDDFARRRLASQIEKEMMDPKEREIQELRQQLESKTKAEQEFQEKQRTEAEQAEYQRARQEAQKKYDSEITEVLNKAGLPKKPYVVKRVAQLMYTAIQHGYELDVATAVDRVKEDLNTDFSAMAGDLDAERLVKFLGPDITKKIRQHDIAQWRAKQQSTEPTPADRVEQATKPRSRPSDDQKMTPDEWREHLRKKAGLS